MPTPRATVSSADVAAEVGSLSAGLGIVTMALFPFALPALVFLLPLALLPLAGLLLAAPILLPLWLVRRVRRHRSRRRRAAEDAAGLTPRLALTRELT